MNDRTVILLQWLILEMNPSSAALSELFSSFKRFLFVGFFIWIQGLRIEEVVRCADFKAPRGTFVIRITSPWRVLLVPPELLPVKTPVNCVLDRSSALCCVSQKQWDSSQAVLESISPVHRQPSSVSHLLGSKSFSHIMNIFRIQHCFSIVWCVRDESTHDTGEGKPVNCSLLHKSEKYIQLLMHKYLPVLQLKYLSE